MKTILSVLVMIIGFSAIGQPPHAGTKGGKRMEKIKNTLKKQN